MNENEQELMMRQKIEKREKFDIFLAYLLIVILLGCIGVITYLKFIKKEQNVEPQEQLSHYITKEEIITGLNNGSLANELSLTAENSEEGIKIDYTDDNEKYSLNIPIMENELEINLNDNEATTTKIYKEISKIICTYYGNEEQACSNTIETLDINNQVEGIRYVKETNNIYINMSKSIEITATNTIDTYTKETTVEVTETNYNLNLENVTISNIILANNNTSFMVKGHILTNNEKDILKVNVKLYDENNNVISENNQEYTSENPLSKEDDFTVTFELNEDLKFENIKKYSINVIR